MSDLNVPHINSMRRKPTKKAEKAAADLDAEWRRLDMIRSLYGPQPDLRLLRECSTENDTDVTRLR